MKKLLLLTIIFLFMFSSKSQAMTKVEARVIIDTYKLEKADSDTDLKSGYYTLTDTSFKFYLPDDKYVNIKGSQYTQKSCTLDDNQEIGLTFFTASKAYALKLATEYNGGYSIYNSSGITSHKVTIGNQDYYFKAIDGGIDLDENPNPLVSCGIDYISSNFNPSEMGKVTIYQNELTGRKSSCNQCAWDNLIQNSGLIKDSKLQCSGTITDANKSNWENYENIYANSGYAGDTFDAGEGKLGRYASSNANEISWLNTLSDDSSWSVPNAGSFNGSSYEINNKTVVKFGEKDIKDLEYTDLVTIMKVFFNNDYFVIMGVGDGENNGDTNYKAKHVVLLAGVNETDFYINDSGYGKVTKYQDNYKNDKVKWILPIKNTITSTRMICGGEKAEITKKDEEVSNTLNISTHILKSNKLEESDISAYYTLSEANLEELLADATIYNLNGDELESLTLWKQQVEEESKLYRVARIITVLVGIVLVLWGFLFYIAFWCDKINTILDVSFIGILTLGYLRLSDDETSSTYGERTKSVKTVIHSDAVKISLISMFFGTLIMTGTLYKIIGALILTIRRIFKL